jgi:hypothetical protein
MEQHLEVSIKEFYAFVFLSLLCVVNKSTLSHNNSIKFPSTRLILLVGRSDVTKHEADGHRL